MVAEPQPYRFTVEEYERLLPAGVFTEDDRVELIEGEILMMCPIGGRHVRALNRLTRHVVLSVGPDLSVSVQNPVRLRPRSEPQPDLAVVREDPNGDGVADVVLLIEVADSSIGYNRRTKLPLYARAGMAEAWLVDLQAATIERHSEPRDGQYRTVARAESGEALTSLVLPSLTIPADVALG